MNKHRQGVLCKLILFLFFSLSVAWTVNAEEKTLTLGVFAYLPKTLVIERFQPLAKYLSEQLYDTRVELQVLGLEELENALDKKLLDFVFTNPNHYVQLRSKTRFTGALATLINIESGQAVDTLGGVIIVRKDSNIHTAADLARTKIAIPGKKYFGGYQAQVFELLKDGISVTDKNYEIVEGHFNIVARVSRDRNIAGFVRTGIIEELVRMGELDPTSLRIINEKTYPGFPYRVSTNLYPEWAFVALPHVDKRITQKVASSLMSLDENHPVAKAARIGGIAPPGDYLPVENIARFLRIPPYDQTPVFTLHEVWERWLAIWLSILATVLLSLIYIIYRLTKDKKSLQRLNEQSKKAENELRVAAVVFEAHEGMFVTNDKVQILKINEAFSSLTGYQPDDIIGQLPTILDSGERNPDFHTIHWMHIKEKGAWQGEIVIKKKNGALFPAWLTISSVRDPNHTITHYVSTFSDLTDYKEKLNEIHHLAYFDSLTGLPNRRLLTDRLQHAIGNTHRTNLKGALYVIDLDNFKNLNDTYGHGKGDQLLRVVADRLTANLRANDTIGRLGGDEFVVIAECLSENLPRATTQAAEIGEKLLRLLDEPYALEDGHHHSSSSIGIALFGDENLGTDEILRQADMAMYEAKNSGRNTFRFFDFAMQQKVVEQNEIEDALLVALREQQFALFFQPQVDVSGAVVGAEALIRWFHPQKGIISPAKFIPVAERCGLIVPIGSWVVGEACKRLALWQKENALAHITLSVNVSARQFKMPTFVDEVARQLSRHDVDPALLKVELTESMLLEHTNEIIEKMKSLQKIGVKFSLDDFGTGYSSLLYLKEFPIEQIKIDRSFVSNLEKSNNDAIICAAIINLAHSMHFDVVAEGVETERQRAFLVEQNRCDYLQGYLFSPPLAIDDFEKYVLAGRTARTAPNPHG